MTPFEKDIQYYKFCAYGFLKNLRFFDAFLLLFFLENGISYAQIGILYAAREIVTNVAEIPSGIVADTYGRKRSLVAAFGAYLISFGVFYYSSDFNLLLVAMLMFGIGDAFRSGTHKGMIMDYLRMNNWEDQKINYYGHTRSWSQMGSAISALLAGLLVLYSGNYRFIYLLSMVPYLLNFINIITYPEELNRSIKPKKGQAKQELGGVVKSFFQVIRKPGVFQIMHSSALHSAFLKSIKDYIQLIMVQVSLLIPTMYSLDPKRKSGLVIGVIYFLIFLMTSYASKNSFRIFSKGFKNISHLTLVAGLIAGALSGLFLSLDLWGISLVFFVSVYVLENIRKPIMTGILSDEVPNEIFTSVISAQSFYKTLLISSLAVSLGVLADHFGLGISLLTVSALLLLISLAIGLLGSSTGKKI